MASVARRYIVLAFYDEQVPGWEDKYFPVGTTAVRQMESKTKLTRAGLHLPMLFGLE